MRKLMWFTIGFVLACGSCAYVSEAEWILPAAAVLTAATVCYGCILRRPGLLRRLLAILLGCLTGLGWFGTYRMLYLSTAMALEGQHVFLELTAFDYSYETYNGIGVDAAASIGGKPYQIRAYINDVPAMEPGDKASGTFRLVLTLRDREQSSAWFQSRGMFLQAYPEGEVTVTAGEKVPFWCFPAVLRRNITEALDSMFPSDTAPFAKALLLGDSRDLSYETNTAFRVSGIRHIIAVSGLHISILYGLICVVTLRRRFLTALAGMPVLLLFAAVAGFTPSVTRACIMVWLMLLAMVLERDYDPPTALSFAVLVMLFVNPLAVTSASLQMSVACVAGILLFHDPISRWLKGKIPEGRGIARKLRAMLCSSISVSLSAMSFVTPFSAFYFGTVSLVSVLTNLLTLWVVNLIFNGLVVICLLYLIWPTGAGILALVLSWPIRYVCGVSGILAAVPMAAVYTKSVYIVLWLAFVYVLLAVFLLDRQKRPGILFCCGVLGLCLSLLASWAEPLLSDVRITMLDVGQGQSILLQTEGKTFLVDCGGDTPDGTADLVGDTLLSMGISHLDGIILTHYDADHSGGLPYLLTRIRTDLLLLPDTWNQMEIPAHSGDTIYIREDAEVTLEKARLAVYGPIYSGMDNENSLCVLFDTEKCDILITGDRSSFGERMLMRRRQLPDVDILVAGHHGAADAASEELLAMVRPETVLISVGQENFYGHPSDKLLRRLEQHGIAVFRTDENGTIIIRR